MKSISTLSAVILLSVVLALFIFRANEPNSAMGLGDEVPEIPTKLPTRIMAAGKGRIEPVAYSIGNLDLRFNISTTELLALIDEARGIWEAAAGRRLFEYNADAAFKINLIFDERQQKVLDERRMKARLDRRESSAQTLQQEYDAVKEQKDRLQKAHESDVSRFKNKLDDYNARVEELNENGGAPQRELESLEQERKQIEAMKIRIEESLAALNETIARLNSLALALNKTVDDYNDEIKSYNGRFVRPREFEKGLFNGKEINIYEVEGEDDLRMTLVHELGHALGFQHVDDPEAVMYYKLEKQDLRNVRLSEADLQLVRATFGDREH